MQALAASLPALLGALALCSGFLSIAPWSPRLATAQETRDPLLDPSGEARAPQAGMAAEALPPQAGLAPEAAGRIWGRVETTSGAVHEGFIRWDRNEASWVDLLDGNKTLVPEDYRIWNDRADSAELVPNRVVEYGRFRVSFPDHLSTFPLSAQSGIRFGHLRRLEVRDERGAYLELRSGEVIELSSTSTDLGRRVRQILVDEPGRGLTELRWGDLVAIDFQAAPPGAAPRARRLHGTVRDRSGHAYTGFLSLGADKILDTDSLVGREGGQRREIPLALVTALARAEGAARVTLTSGQTLLLSGPGDVGPGSQRIVVSDPGLGSVEVRWRELDFVRLHPPERTPGYDDFDGGHPLRGTAVTRGGSELMGWIRWDADEEYSWELLDGNRAGVAFGVEMGKIASIARLPGEGEAPAAGAVAPPGEERDGARVTLRDGRTLELSGSNDVSRKNKGIFVRLDPEGGAAPPLGTGAAPPLETGTGPSQPQWISVRWADLRELRFHP